MGEGVTLVSSAEETAKEVYRRLTERRPARRSPERRGAHEFLATGDPDAFADFGRRFLGPEIERVGLVPSFCFRSDGGAGRLSPAAR